MGEVADLMIDGTLCHVCGVYLKGEAEGFPRYCTDCKPTVNCPDCNKKVKGLADHIRDKHTKSWLKDSVLRKYKMNGGK